MRSRFLQVTGACAAGASALAYAAYRKDIEAARQQTESDRQFIDSPEGPIEFAEAGDGPAVLVIHGAGGGFDQGLDLGEAFVGDGYRVIAPSRFGYLGTPLRVDASPEAQADAHLRLLDALQLDTVPVIGVSAGAPSAMQLCLRHPERCTALVLAVPLTWTPDRPRVNAPSPFFETVLKTISTSDFLFWIATKVAKMTLLQTILGTPARNYRTGSNADRRNVNRMLDSILPITGRVAGIVNDSAVSASLTRYPLEAMRVPTLVISAADDGYDTYDGSLYTAEQIHDGEFIGFPTGGHLLLGHDAEVRSRVRRFLAERGAMERKARAV